MARLARLSVAGQVHLVIQRGNNAQPIAGDDADRGRFLTMLGEAARSHRLEIHAYALTDNEFLMLATPADAVGLGRTMQSLGRRYVAYFNQRHVRSGTLWDGRFRSTVIEAALHLRDCMCFVESAPLRAGLVPAASDHPWSSARHHLGFAIDPLVTDPPVYWESGNTPFEREDAHRALLERGLASEDAFAIEACGAQRVGARFGGLRCGDWSASRRAEHGPDDLGDPPLRRRVPTHDYVPNLI